MATRKRTTSESGAYMSQYDTEVEKRLVAIEAEIKAIKEGLANHGHTSAGGGGGGDVDALVARLNQIPTITDYCKKDPDGVRRFKI